MAYNVLIVDDSLAMRSVIKKAIVASGINVNEFYEASDGVEALSVLRRHRPDLILTDFNMPNMDGMSLLLEIKKDDQLKSIPIVITSVEGSLKRVKAFIEGGAAGYIRKPFTPEEARDKLNTILGVNPNEKNQTVSGGENLDF